MRISDCSSDVCSSALRLRAPAALAVSAGSVIVPRMIARGFAALSVLLLAGCVSQPELAREGTYDRADTLFDPARAIQQDWRSEEHTSELQSLMLSSYAVFCLKKKKYNII